MSDFILIEGDKASFMPSFGVAVVAVRPGDLQGSGPCSLKGRRICVEGDEARLSVSGCTYMTPQYSIPGVGTLTIAALAGDQTAGKTATGGRKVLLKGSRFTARFEVQNPAKQPPPAPGPPTPDPTPSYSGTGTFITTNAHFRGV